MHLVTLHKSPKRKRIMGAANESRHDGDILARSELAAAVAVSCAPRRRQVCLWVNPLHTAVSVCRCPAVHWSSSPACISLPPLTHSTTSPCSPDHETTTNIDPLVQTEIRLKMQFFWHSVIRSNTARTWFYCLWQVFYLTYNSRGLILINTIRVLMRAIKIFR